LAKIGSKWKKPNGLTCVKGYDLERFLEKVAIEKVCGFGPASTALLAKHGVFTVWDYVSRPEGFAKRLLGKTGSELWRELRGRPVYPVLTGPAAAPASINKAKTFTPPSEEREFVRAQLLRNIESAFIKLRRHRLRAGAIGIFLKDESYRGFGMEAELGRAVSATHEAARVAALLFERIFVQGKKYRQTGVFLNRLESDLEVQHELFEDPCQIRRLKDISHCVDEVNRLYGKHCLHLGSTSAVDRFGQHLGERGDTASRKVNLLKGESFRRRAGIPLWNLKV